MRRLLRLIPRLKPGAICLCVLLLAGPSSAQPPKPPSGFVAVDEVPPGEQIPAINLVAAAYGLVWVALLGYVWSIGRRLQKVEGELAELESRRK
jgi:CcmD family protein